MKLMRIAVFATVPLLAACMHGQESAPAAQVERPTCPLPSVMTEEGQCLTQVARADMPPGMTAFDLEMQDRGCEIVLKGWYSNGRYLRRWGNCPSEKKVASVEKPQPKLKKATATSESLGHAYAMERKLRGKSEFLSMLEDGCREMRVSSAVIRQQVGVVVGKDFNNTDELLKYFADNVEVKICDDQTLSNYALTGTNSKGNRFSFHIQRKCRRDSNGKVIENLAYIGDTPVMSTSSVNPLAVPGLGLSRLIFDEPETETSR